MALLNVVPHWLQEPTKPTFLWVWIRDLEVAKATCVFCAHHFFLYRRPSSSCWWRRRTRKRRRWSSIQIQEGGDLQPSHTRNHPAAPRTWRGGMKDVQGAVGASWNTGNSWSRRGFWYRQEESLMISCSLSAPSSCSCTAMAAALPRCWWQGCRSHCWSCGQGWWRLKQELYGGDQILDKMEILSWGMNAIMKKIKENRYNFFTNRFFYPVMLMRRWLIVTD